MAAGTTPSVPFVGVAVNDPPLQTVVDIPVIAGIGLTVIVTVNADPVQAPDKGVTE